MLSRGRSVGWSSRTLMGMPTMVCSPGSLQERHCLETPTGSTAVKEGCLAGKEAATKMNGSWG